AVSSPGDSGSADLHSVSFGARFCSPFAAPVLLQGFLTVREVAARLSVSTATVYKLCAAGKLAHVRVLGAIRVAPVNLAAFIERQSILTDNPFNSYTVASGALARQQPGRVAGRTHRSCGAIRLGRREP